MWRALFQKQRPPAAGAVPPARAPAGKGAFHDPAALMRIQQLEFRARLVVEGLWQGLHRSPRHGFSTEFTEYRPYAAGDDPRYLDWKVFARSDRYYLQKFEDETNLGCLFLLDRSGSMAYGSLGYRKVDYAATLIATLGLFLQAQGDALGLMSFADQLLAYAPPSRRCGHLHHLMSMLEGEVAGRATDLDAPLTRVPQLMQRRSALVLVSDLFAPIEKLEQRLGEWLACGHEASIFQILDPRELTFDFDQATELIDLESERRLNIEPAQARERYLERLQAHLTAVEDLCRKLGAHYHRFDTARPLELALFDYLTDRDRLGPVVKRGRAKR